MKLLALFLFTLTSPLYGQDPCAVDAFVGLKQQVVDFSTPLIEPQCGEFGIHDLSVLEHPKGLNPLVLMFYRQKEPKLVDPVADYYVMDFVDRTINHLKGKKGKDYSPETVFRAKLCADALFGLDNEEDVLTYQDKNFYKLSGQYQRDLKLLQEVLRIYTPEERKKILELFEAGKINFESNKSPINPTRLAQSFISVIEEEEKNGINLERGGKHRWSEEFKEHRGIFTSARLKSFGSKILMSLAGGKGNDVLITGQEETLRSFMETLPDQSLTPEELFRKSYQLNKGNLYSTLLTIENVLSSQWRNPKRDQLTTTGKLKPFSKVYGTQGDVFGHWYHMFGMVFFGSVEGKTRAMIAAKSEGLGSQILSHFQGETQENLVNDKAGVVGAYLRRYVSAREKGKTYRLPKAAKEPVDDTRKLLEKEIKRALKE
jgi:hypothetical protein